MSRFVDIDLAELPPPDAVVPPVYEDLLAARKQTILDRIADPALRADVASVLALESEPMTKDAEAGAYRELLVYQRINDAVRGVLLPTATGADLDSLASRLGVLRMSDPGDDEADPPVAAWIEDDARLRERYQLALEAFSTAGPYGAYRFHALSAHPYVKDVGVYGPEEEAFVDPGEAYIVVLSRIGSGVPDANVLNSVTAALNNEDVRPLTDLVVIAPATIVNYAISVHLELRRGPDPALIAAEVTAALQAYAASRHRVGAVVAISGLYDAAHTPNVERATLISPAAEVDPGLQGAAWCTGVTVTWEIV